MFTLNSNERLISETDLQTTPLNTRSAQRFAVGTVIDFTGNVQLVEKTTERGRHYLILSATVTKPGASPESDYRVPATMLLRCPFERNNRQPMENRGPLQTALLQAVESPNPGLALWQTIRGRRIRVATDVTCQDRPFGQTQDAPVDFNIFEYA